MGLFLPHSAMCLALIIGCSLPSMVASAEAQPRAKRQAKDMLSGPIISGGTNLCQRGDQILVMDRANFGGPIEDPSFGPSYRLELEHQDSCLHYLADNGKTLPGKLPNALAVKVFENLGRHEGASPNLVDFIVRVAQEISWVGVKRPFQRPYLSYISSQANCTQVRSLVGYFQGQAMISIDEFNRIPAEQQVLTVIHEILRRIQIDYLGDLSPAMTMALEQTTNAMMVGSAEKLDELPLFKILAQRIADSHAIQSICGQAVKLSGISDSESRTVRGLCRRERLLSSLNSRGMSSWVAQIRQQTRQSYQRAQKSLTADQQKAYDELYEDMAFLELPGVWGFYSVPVAPGTGAAARAIRQSTPSTPLNLYSLNFEQEDREATCEVLKALQW